MRIHLLLSLLSALTLAWAVSRDLERDVGEFYNSTEGGHTNNWAVLVCTSRYWFNYRHMANTLAMYRTIKRLGIPDSNILLMLADDVSCNARNPFPAQVYANKDRRIDLYGDGIEVDYRGYEVTVESFLRLLTGRQPAHTPPSKRLLTDASSNVFIYMTGHGGNEFLKFQDNEEVSAFDIADAIEQMSEKRRFNKLFFAVDTCQANSLYSKFYSPNVISTGSSEIGENSYSHHNDMDIGVAVIDSYTHHVLQYLETIQKDSKQTLQDLFDDYNPVLIHSNPGISTHLSATKPDGILVTDFFGGVAKVEVTPSRKALHSEGQEIVWQVSEPVEKTGLPSIESAASPVTQAKRPAGGWSKPLTRRYDTTSDRIKTGMAVGALVAMVWMMLRTETKGARKD